MSNRNQALVLGVAVLTIAALACQVPIGANQAQATAEPSEIPTEISSPTPEAPAAQMSENTNCRTGPLAVYDLIATYLTGKVLEITGRNAEGDYWYVADREAGDRECWL